jgi:hypothetical protein
MASFQNHFEHIKHNIFFLESFIFERANDWALTVMFYASVHICEALIYNEFKKLIESKKEPNFPQDCNDHLNRHSTIHSLFYYNFEGGTSFCENYSSLDKAAHDARYKIYKIRRLEVFNKYSLNFKPILTFFNSYCNVNGIKGNLSLKEYKFSFEELRDGNNV